MRYGIDISLSVEASGDGAADLDGGWPGDQGDVARPAQ